MLIWRISYVLLMWILANVWSPRGRVQIPAAPIDKSINALLRISWNLQVQGRGLGNDEN